MSSRTSITRLTLLLALLLLASCRQQEDESRLVASVYGHELRQSALDGLVGEGLSEEDSIAIVDNYVDQWIRQTVMLTKAEKNVTADFSRQLGEYRNSLLIYAYEQQILNQLLDTTVSEEQLEDYYNLNQGRFLLKNSIVKAVYVISPRKSPADAKLRAMVSKRVFVDEDIIDLEELASRYGLQGYYDGNTWMPFYALQAAVPITTYNENLFLKQNRSIVFSDDSLAYYVRILDYKISDDVAPLEMQKENIRASIINLRKLDILSKLQSDLLAEAENGGHVKRNKKAQ